MRQSVKNLQILARFKADSLAWIYGYFRASTRIAPDPCFSGLNGEDAEAAQLYAIPLYQALLHGIEDGVDCSLCFGPNEAGAFYDSLDKILLDQWTASADGGGNGTEASMQLSGAAFRADGQPFLRC